MLLLDEHDPMRQRELGGGGGPGDAGPDHDNIDHDGHAVESARPSCSSLSPSVRVARSRNTERMCFIVAARAASTSWRSMASSIFSCSSQPGDAAHVDEHREHELGLVSQRGHRRFEVLVLRGPLDEHVELAVAGGRTDHVIVGGGVAAGVDARPHGGEIVVGTVARGELGGVGLEHLPQLEQLARTRRLEPGHVGAPARDHLDQARGLEGPQRLSHRIARDAELFREAVLEEPLTGRQHARDDHVANLVGGHLAQGSVCAANRHAPRLRSRPLHFGNPFT